MAEAGVAGGRPVLCLVTDRRAARGPLEEIVGAAVEAGVDRVQIREREMETAALLEHVESLACAARRACAQVELTVNRRTDVALAADLTGVHLGFDAVRPEAARQLMGPGALVGASLHDPAELNPLTCALLSYAHLAPIFPPISKATTRTLLGLAGLRSACRAGLPILAQGGVDPLRAAACVEAGAAGVAVSGSILSASDPGRAAAALREALDQ